MNVHASIFTEIVDAGDFLSPQSVVGSGITAIHGSVGGDTDPVDAFRFWFAGGFLGVTAESWVCPGVDPWSNTDPRCRQDLNIGLFKVAPLEPVDPCQSGDPCHNDLGLLEIADLSAGNYVVGVCYPPNPCITDPPFLLSFFDATGGPAQISAPVPEPATTTLVAIGVAVLATVRRRRTPEVGIRFALRSNKGN